MDNHILIRFYKKYVKKQHTLLPNSLEYIKKVLDFHDFSLSNATNDGRTNSCIDEETITNILKNHIHTKKIIKFPKKRMWYDILVYDNKYKWFPVNIKTTTTNTSDNSGNLSLCIQSYTNYKLDYNKTYNNGYLAEKFIKCLKKGKFNNDIKKDYFFLVINKNTQQIIINSVLGLTTIVPNINNLPFQIKWKNNQEYNFISFNNSLNMVLEAFKKPKRSWKETFLYDIRQINI